MKGRGEVPTVFLRKATGLVRQIGLFTAILITLCYTVGLGWQKRVFQFSGSEIVPENQYLLGINPMVMAFIIIGFIVLLAVYTFGIVTAAMPRAGGGYVVISRVLHPYLGYIGTWFWFMATAVSYGLIGTAVIEVPLLIFPSLFPGAESNPLRDTTIDPAAREALLFGLGAVIVVVFAVIALFGVRLTGLLLQVLFVIPAALTIVTYSLLASANADSITAGMQGLYGTTPASVTAEAVGQGLGASPATYGAAFGTATLGAYWAYEGYAATTFVAGEVKEANRNLPRSLFIAGAVIVLVYISASSLLYRATSLVGQTTVGGDQYSLFSAWAFLSYGGGDLDVANTALNSTIPQAWLPLVAALQAQGAGLGFFIFFLGVFAVLWVMNDIPPFILTASRSLFAMSFDRTLPAKFSDVSERWHSPTWAILFTMVVGIYGALSEAEGGYGVIGGTAGFEGVGNVLSRGVAATDIWDITFFSLFSLAAAILPFVRRDIYNTAPYKPRIGPLPIITLTGFASFFGHIYLAYLMLNSPSGYAINGDLLAMTANDAAVTLTPFFLTLGLFVVFTLVYFAYTSRGRAKGANYKTIYTEIPPE